mgnify:CR=1 FL=1
MEGDTLVYHAMPSRQEPAVFRSISVANDAVTFEDKAHDFPQRIIYRRVGADSVVARIEGTVRGQARGVDFPFARVRCDATRRPDTRHAGTAPARESSRAATAPSAEAQPGPSAPALRDG